MITPFADFYQALTSNLLWSQGAIIWVPLLLLGLVGLRKSRPLFYLTAVVFVLCFYFFRSPDRICVDALSDPRVIVCPADGEVVFVGRDANTPHEYDKKIAIFLSPWDVHVTWVPVSGVVESVVHTPGQFFHAKSKEGSLWNEHNDVTIQTTFGYQVMVRQIAGRVARRIVCWVAPEDMVHGAERDGRAEKFGMIRFGSRVELFLPDSAEIFVKEGQRVFGGQTAIGRME